MRTLERWWNDHWGQSRRVIRLRINGVKWRVEAGAGNGDAKYWIRDYPTEAQAQAVMEAMRERTRVKYGDVWRDIGGGDD